MFKLLCSFNVKGKSGYVYKRATNLYYSPEFLEDSVESSKSLVPIDKGIKLSDFILSL